MKQYEEIIKKYLVGVIIIIALAIGVTMVVMPFVKDEDPASSMSDSQNNTTTKISEVNENALPSKFPINIPLESNAKITQNYNATTDDGVFQASRGFVSNKTIDENFAIYSKFITTNGWRIKSSKNDPNYKMLTGVKGNAEIQVTISLSEIDKTNTVVISYSEKP